MVCATAGPAGFAAGPAAAHLLAATPSPHPATDTASPPAVTVAQQPFGATADGAAVTLFTLANGRGMTVRLINYGAILTAVEVPDRQGRPANVVLYVETLGEYLAGAPAGAVVGRYANRIGGAKFTLDGVTYALTPNSGANHIHGGKQNFSKAVWKAEPAAGDGWAGVRLAHTSPDGDEGYPGTLRATVTYALTAANELRMEYEATTDKPTIVNLTNHAYWNLAGAGVGDVLSHRLTVNADRFLAVDDALIPTGELRSVVGTPLDFRTPETVGARIGELPATRGYDHCYVLNKKTPGDLSLAARAVEPAGGRTMEVWTTYPGVQLYTANHLSGKQGAGGRTYPKHGALCLETQFFPDSPNKPQFPSTVLRPGQTYRQTTVHKFGVE
jgi:aldose 1-epimerase